MPRIRHIQDFAFKYMAISRRLEGDSMFEMHVPQPIPQDPGIGIPPPDPNRPIDPSIPERPVPHPMDPPGEVPPIVLPPSPLQPPTAP